jgi:hypothetical protein
VPFVLVTACGAADLPEPALGEAPRLGKPCDQGALGAVVAGLLAA